MPDKHEETVMNYRSLGSTGLGGHERRRSAYVLALEMFRPELPDLGAHAAQD